METDKYVLRYLRCSQRVNLFFDKSLFLHIVFETNISKLHLGTHTTIWANLLIQKSKSHNAQLRFLQFEHLI